MKLCSKCSKTLLFSNFYKDKSRKSGYTPYCKFCIKYYQSSEKIKNRKKLYDISYRKENKASINKSKDKWKRTAKGLSAEKRYRQNNKGLWNAKTAKYRAVKLKRTPSWVDLSKIKEIYKNCPEGYHVDHIIPLQGKNVSGLHIETNLQYLIAEDNLAKGNKF